MSVIWLINLKIEFAYKMQTLYVGYITRQKPTNHSITNYTVRIPLVIILSS